MMQEEITQRSVAVVTRGAQMTARLLAKAMQGVLRQMRRGRDKPGKHNISVLDEGGKLESIPITSENIKDFETFARKHGVKYELVKDSSVDPPKWLALFRAKDIDAMPAALGEFVQKTLNKEAEKPSTREAMAELKPANKKSSTF